MPFMKLMGEFKMILLIDNYDSFAYNLYQLIGSITDDIKVIRNDELTVEQITALNPAAIVISPGPGRPKDAGVIEDVIRYFYDKKPLLGICLGHQALCEVFNGKITYAKKLMHGKSSLIKTVDDKLFKGIIQPFSVARYHSLVVAKETIASELKILAISDDGEIMAVKHRDYPVYGLQFHPESILTSDGKKIIENFLGGNKMIKEAILKLAKKQDLTASEARACMNEIMDGQASDVQMSSYLTALSLKGETIEEITGSAAGMREHCIKLLNDEDVLEIVGTGGDGSNSFNISTTSSIVIAASGVKVAKHGNRAASSKCGAADVLESLGIKIDVSPQKSATILNKINICFLFAQNYHIAMKYVAPIRRELGIRTVFNILGPLTNPAGANMQVMGVYEEALVEPLAEVLSNLGVKRAMVVYGQDGLDEISLSAPTTVCEVKDGSYISYTITPEQFGMTRCQKEDLIGGSPEFNAKITRDILRGVKGPKRDAVLLNAGAAIYIAGRTETMQEGIDLATQLIDEGKALTKLEEFIKETNM